MPIPSEIDYEAYFKVVQEMLSKKQADPELFSTIVNAPFSDRLTTVSFGLGIVVLLLVDKNTHSIDRIALSDTDLARGATSVSVKPFHEIKIPVDNKENIIAKAIATGKSQQTGDWQYLFTPVLTAQEARFNQAGAGVGCSVVYPLQAREGGALIFSFFREPKHINKEHHAFMERLTKLVNAALEN